MKHAKSYIALICLILIAGIGGAILHDHYVHRAEHNTSYNTPLVSHTPQTVQVSPVPDSAHSIPDSRLIIPNSVQHDAPFTPQAPTANWDALHGEACEEASVIMAQAFFNRLYTQDAKLPAKYVEEELTKLTTWETETFGYYLDIDTAETATMVKEVYGLETKIIIDLSEENLKKELAEGHLIIFPAAGRKLKNPNYRPPGPPYHMIVLTGYTQDHFISNDPGTRRGQNYTYTYDTLFEANGTWNHNTHTVDTDNKAALVVWK